MASDNELEEIDSELGEILRSSRKIKSDDEAYALLANLVAATSRINFALATTANQTGVAQSLTTPTSVPSGPMASLQDWVQKIKSALGALAAFLKAASYTIGVSVPLGLTVQITFSV